MLLLLQDFIDTFVKNSDHQGFLKRLKKKLKKFSSCLYLQSLDIFLFVILHFNYIDAIRTMYFIRLKKKYVVITKLCYRQNVKPFCMLLNYNLM